MAAELDDIIACALKRWRAAPHFGVGDADADLLHPRGRRRRNLIQMMHATVVDNRDFSASEVEASRRRQDRSYG